MLDRADRLPLDNAIAMRTDLAFPRRGFVRLKTPEKGSRLPNLDYPETAPAVVY